MSIFNQIKIVLSASNEIEKYADSVKSVEALDEKVQSLEKVIEEQRAMILYLSTIQSDLVNECYSISDALKSLTVPKKTSLFNMVGVPVDDDDDLIN